MSLEGNKADDATAPTIQSPFVFTRWKRFGHDRVYVADPGGTKLGHIDVALGEFLLEPSADTEEVRSAAQAWFAENGIELSGQAPVTPYPAPETAALPPSLVEETVSTSASALNTTAAGDLATNVPAQALVDRADAEWKAFREDRPILSRVAKIVGADTPDQSWRKGAAGEREVARRLEQLTRDGWRILHSVPVGKRGSDIDHIVIGPPGVYCLNTKNHPNKNVWVGDRMIMVNGNKTDYLRNSRFEAERASKILTEATGWKIDVRPVVVIMGAEMTVKAQPPDVNVIARRNIPRVFRKAPAAISDEAVETIFSAARNPAIWIA